MAKLYFYYGSMDCGKSTILLQSAYNYSTGGKSPLLLKPSTDTRTGNFIESRIGIKMPCVLINDSSDIESLIKDHDCVLVDEAQFLTENQVKELAGIVITYQIPVLCYGLRTDYMGNLFEGSRWLFSLAQEINEIKSICKYCTSKATHVILRQNGVRVTKGDQIVIGWSGNYVSVCYKHFLQK